MGRRERPVVPALVGITEVAAMMGRSKQRAWAWTRVHGFPEHVVELAFGRLWLEAEVDDWLIANGHRLERGAKHARARERAAA
jgi:predicted DNA-binding transcriptional regulator AlpA